MPLRLPLNWPSLSDLDVHALVGSPFEAPK